MTTSPAKLKILVIDEYFPYPPDSGKPIRTWNLLKRLSAKHEVTLLCYGNGHDAQSCNSKIRAEFVEPLKSHTGLALYARLAANTFSTFPYSVSKHYAVRLLQRMRKLIETNDFDLVQCEWTPYARYLDSFSNFSTIIATHNVESQIWFRRSANSGTFLARLFYRMQAKKMAVFERRVLRSASWVTAVSNEDAEKIRQWGVENLSVVDNGVDLDYYRPGRSLEQDNEMLFLASLDWEPNIDGLNHFVTEILPLITLKQPNAILTIAGRRPIPELRKRMEAIPNVHFVGEVPDVRPLLERAAVVVVPLRVGGGSRLKILEAMAMAKAVVSTSVGAEGLSVRDDEQLVIANVPAEFADAVTGLIASPEKRGRLGDAGRRLVEDQYGWDSCAEKLEDAWHRAIQAGRAQSAPKKKS